MLTVESKLIESNQLQKLESKKTRLKLESVCLKQSDCRHVLAGCRSVLYDCSVLGKKPPDKSDPDKSQPNKSSRCKSPTKNRVWI